MSANLPQPASHPPRLVLVHLPFSPLTTNSRRLHLPDFATPSYSALEVLALRIERAIKGSHRRKFSKLRSAVSELIASTSERQNAATNASAILVDLPPRIQEYFFASRQRRDSWPGLGVVINKVCAEFIDCDVRVFVSASQENALDARETSALKIALSPLVPVFLETSEVDELDHARIKEYLGYTQVLEAKLEVGEVSKAASQGEDDALRLRQLTTGRMAPRNDIVALDESQAMPTLAWQSVRASHRPSREVVVIACMKNEGPFLLEWVAYHRCLGVDHFVIYTNDCDDGTDTLLDRLSLQGFITRVENSDFRGQSPQKFALDDALKLDIVRRAEWLIHIDADEFINIRTGDGTWADLLEAMPKGVTNIAMTWRIFGSAGVRVYADTPIIGQFTRCAPSYLPKPHTNWGFKTATRNTGAYARLSCHRPNELNTARADTVTWANGSGKQMPSSYHQKGWRSDVKTIGYDLVQLNHYPLRSAESFLVKRQRGRALHVDREIGENYWTRMDWNYVVDVTILRHLDRVHAETAAIVARDPEVARLHEASVRFHQAKIKELLSNSDFRSLFDKVVQIDLDLGQRVLRCLDNDMET